MQQANGRLATASAIETAAAIRTGTVILGKTNVARGLTDYQSDNPVYGCITTLHHPAYSPGSSWGGLAAAFAAAMVPLSCGRCHVLVVP